MLLAASTKALLPLLGPLLLGEEDNQEIYSLGGDFYCEMTPVSDGEVEVFVGAPPHCLVLLHCVGHLSAMLALKNAI